jgi:hypothetical protein
MFNGSWFLVFYVFCSLFAYFVSCFFQQVFDKLLLTLPHELTKPRITPMWIPILWRRFLHSKPETRELAEVQAKQTNKK